MPDEPRFRRSRRQRTRWDTQDAAWAEAQPRQGTICAEVLDIIKASPRTCDEVEEFTGKPHQTISAAINALMRDGLIRAIDKRPTRSRRPANVWQAVLPGEDGPQVKASGEPKSPDGCLFAEAAPQKGYRY
jgi:hypothetical protein